VTNVMNLAENILIRRKLTMCVLLAVVTNTLLTYTVEVKFWAVNGSLPSQYIPSFCGFM
jgi:hypothetical protein